MSGDTPPNDHEILEAVGDGIDPRALITLLQMKHPNKKDVIEGIQRAIEREKIAFDGEGMIVSARAYA